MTVNVSIGKTHFGRDIMAVHITDESASGHKPKLYFQCLLHARKCVPTFLPDVIACTVLILSASAGTGLAIFLSIPLHQGERLVAIVNSFL